MSDLIFLLPAAVSLWALVTQPFPRMLAWCGVALFPVAVHAVLLAHLQEDPRLFLPLALMAAGAAGIALRWLNDYGQDDDTAPGRLLRVLAVLWGGLSALVLFRLAVAVAQGSGEALLWHGGLAALGLAALALAFWRKAPWLLASGGVALLVLTLASALVMPWHLKSQAASLAEGKPFCLLGPEIGVDDAQDYRYPVRLTPAISAWSDLTFLTLPRPLTLAVLVADPDPDPDFPRREVVFTAFDWSDRAFALQPTYDTFLRRSGASALLDCVPSLDPFALPPDPGLVQAIVIHRPRLTGRSSTATWAPPQTDHYRLPPDAIPRHDGRFRRGEIGFLADLIPDAGRFLVMVNYLPYTDEYLAEVLPRRTRDKDAPLDFTTLALNGFGLHAYEYPAPYSEAVTIGTYAAFGPDGAPVTVIGCDDRSCRHSFRPMPTDRPAQWIVTVYYPPAHLADWRAVEAAALARIAQALAPP